MSVGTPVVECISVTRRFGEVLAVDRASLALQPGEVLAILGPSGCGKTTLLRLIAGFEAVDQGEVWVQGKLASSPSFHLPPERRNVGMVFQEYALFPHLTVAQNVAFGLRKLPRQECQRRLAEVLELVRLRGLEKRYPHELSGGQQQRVALARTLAPRPVTLLLDEPFSNIDASLRSQMRQEVEGILREHGTATIFVTHDRDEAFAMADRVAVMREGRLEQIDTPEAIYHRPADPFVARMAGTCDFLPGEVRGASVVTDLGMLPWTSGNGTYPDGTRVELLVRAEDFQVLPDPQGRCVVVAREFRGDETLLVVRTPSGVTLRCRQRSYSTLPVGARVTLARTRALPFVSFKSTGEG